MIQAARKFDALLSNRFAANLLGDHFVIWQRTNEWSPLNDDLQGLRRITVPRSEVVRVIEAAVHAGHPVLQSLSDGQILWVVPVPDSIIPSVAVRFCSSDPQELLRLLNRTSECAWTREQSLRESEQTIHRQEQQLSMFADQVSADLEELTWLRRLATNLEMTESGNSTDQIAQSVLPGLCDLIGARSLVFMRDHTPDDHGTPGQAIWQTGRTRVPQQVCLEIAYELAGRNKGLPVVVNNWGRRFECDGFSGVKSCILVPVATQSLRLGWLIAVNKEIDSRSRIRSLCGEVISDEQQALDFGSFEASLMSATAVILAAHERNCSLFQEKELLLRGVIRSLINAIDAKDSYTCGHSDRVAELSRLIARSLNMDAAECDQVYMTGLLHDVGKIGVPDGVLQKPGRLTDEEFALIKQHPVIGYEILKHLDNFRYVLPGVLHHHEAIDGSGYPYGLKGEQIPLVARILAVADAYDAMTTNRPYRRGMPSERAEQVLKDGAGRQWDVQCVEAFFRNIHGIRLISAQQAAPEPQSGL